MIIGHWNLFNEFKRNEQRGGHLILLQNFTTLNTTTVYVLWVLPRVGYGTFATDNSNDTRVDFETEEVVVEDKLP